MITDKDIDQIMLQNQNGFEKLPSSQAWEKISIALQDSEINHKKNKLKNWFAAASVLLIVSMGYLFFINNFSNNHLHTSNSPIQPNSGGETMISIDSEDTKEENIPVSVAQNIERIETQPTNKIQKNDNTSIKNTNTKPNTENIESSKNSKAPNDKAPLENKNNIAAKDNINTKPTYALKESRRGQSEPVDDDIAQANLNDAETPFETAMEQADQPMMASKSINKKEKSMLAKSKTYRNQDYYQGQWELKNQLEKEITNDLEKEITLIFNENESVDIIGIDKKIQNYTIESMNELHLSLVNKENNQIKISYLSSKECVLVFKNGKNPSTIVLNRK